MSEDTREAIIQRFEAALVQMRECSRYTPEDVDELESAAWDALPLLKEQEPVMHSSRRGTNGISLVWTCGKCGADLEPNNRKARYCSSCGQVVKWE